MKREFSQSVIHVSLCINYDRAGGEDAFYKVHATGIRYKNFSSVYRNWKSFQILILLFLLWKMLMR